MGHAKRIYLVLHFEGCSKPVWPVLVVRHWPVEVGMHGLCCPQMEARMAEEEIAGPNRLHESDYVLLSREPLLGVLGLDTDEGPVDLVINHTGAAMLRDALNKFLAGIESPDQRPLERPRVEHSTKNGIRKRTVLR